MDKDVLRPGGKDITRYATEICDFKKKDKILDIGCGHGDTVELLKSEFGLDAKGIDKNEGHINELQACTGPTDYSFADGGMLDFPSNSFDGIFMECSLSLINDTREAIHEAYCVLKKGGKLVISDLYWKKTTPDHRKVVAQIKEDNNKPHTFGDCESETRVSDCIVDGAFVMEEVMEALKELDMKVLTFENRGDDLRQFVADILFEYGSFEEYAKANPTALCKEGVCSLDLNDKEKNSNLGYFLLIAEKK